MRVFTRFLCISLLLSPLCAASAVYAQEMPLVAKPASVPELDTKTTLNAAEFAAATEGVARTPPQDAYLSYTLQLPKGWSEIGRQIGDGVQDNGLYSGLLSEVSRFVGPPSGSGRRSEIRVSAIQLNYFVSAEHWFTAYVLAQRYALLGMKAISPNRIEASYQTVDGQDENVVRAVLEVNGSRLMLMEYRVPFTRSETEKPLQAAVVSSFKLTNRDRSLPEPVNTRPMFDIAQFIYPGSWFLASPSIRSEEEMRTTLVQTAKDIDNPDTSEIEVDYPTLRGQIEVIGRRRNGPFNEAGLASWLADFMKTRSGIAWGERLPEQPAPFKINAGLQYDGLAAYTRVTPSGVKLPQEIWLLLAHTERYDYALLLSTPDRTTDYSSWARNIAAFELVSRSLKQTEQDKQDK